MHKPPLILVVDDSPSDAILLERALLAAGLCVQIVHDGLTAVAAAQQSQPDLILLDMSMPGQDGLTTCRRLKAQSNTTTIPVIFVTANTDSTCVTNAFAAGGADYVCKPFRMGEIQARVQVHLRLRCAEQELVDRNTRLQDLTQRLAETNLALKRESSVDALTSLLNRRSWDRSAMVEQERARREGSVFSILMLDVDYFKLLNDTRGHPMGDACLSCVAQAIRTTCRMTELIGRFGGEEFIVMAPQTPLQEGVLLAERVRQAVWDAAITHPASPAGRVTISVGVASSEGRELDEVVALADSALYRAKKCGRNLVCGADGTVPCTQSGGSRLEGEHANWGRPDASVAPTVLIVEDNDINRRMYRGCLAKDEYKVEEAENGQRAIEMIEKHTPDVIIMDVMMPVMDGLQCTERLKTNPETRDIPIIIVSACSDSKDILAGLSAGADEYLTKPIRATELAVRVRSMSRLRRERQDLLRSYHLRAEHIRVLSVLVDFCARLANATSQREVLEQTLEASAQIALSQCIWIMLPDEERLLLSLAGCKGLDPEITPELRVPLDESISGRIFASKRSMIINTEAEIAAAGLKPDSDQFPRLPLASTLLYAGGEVLGVLNVAQRVGGRPFEARELEYVELVANIAGSALQMVRERMARDQARDLIVVALAKLAEHRDDDTARHVDRVTRYAEVLASVLQEERRYRDQITDRFIYDLQRAVPLHDIGKVAIPDSILRKPGKLTVQEMAIMSMHADIGAATLRPIIERMPEAGFLRMAEGVIQSHHEWFDGSGYPRGLAAESIPLAARIVALADVYDALTTDRVYKRAISHEEAVGTITELSGKQFDPAVVAAFLDCKDQFRQLALELRDDRSATGSPACLSSLAMT